MRFSSFLKLCCEQETCQTTLCYQGWDDTPNSRFDTITILGCRYNMYCDFFTNFDSTSIAIRYCCVAIFLFTFFTLDHGEKLNDTLNIQTVTIKKKKNTHNSSYFSCLISVFSK